MPPFMGTCASARLPDHLGHDIAVRAEHRPGARRELGHRPLRTGAFGEAVLLLDLQAQSRRERSDRLHAADVRARLDRPNARPDQARPARRPGSSRPRSAAGRDPARSSARASPPWRGGPGSSSSSAPGIGPPLARPASRRRAIPARACSAASRCSATSSPVAKSAVSWIRGACGALAQPLLGHHCVVQLTEHLLERGDLPGEARRTLAGGGSGGLGCVAAALGADPQIVQLLVGHVATSCDRPRA